ncbi:hypothetical protein PIROE2DRAFT_64400 [Piromyces sp. E2]|nr:hypothetical protein PIROE2DRAFT_64400 [Piromyces sp. E2]|eukprot:OUM58469.1 hypothetical protein PIROE2DRAFT_64400 [Piromyces sp. E2]
MENIDMGDVEYGKTLATFSLFYPTLRIGGSNFITDWLLDTYLPKSEEEEANLYLESPWIQEEMKRIQQDLIEVKSLEKKSRDRLLTLKKKYQNLWIISPPSLLDK